MKDQSLYCVHEEIVCPLLAAERIVEKDQSHHSVHEEIVCP